ncbi:MAG: proline racemase family protein [Armatimonadetes bacterium]|nr:proline racemase family protein [Armatimonadota bacterium]
MPIQHLLTTVDTHTEGEPTRIILAGFPFARGATMSERQQDVRERFDHLRRALMHEPRGHGDMFGALVMPPAHPEADLGVLFMDSGGYLNMCGHGVIGVVTAALQTGFISGLSRTRLILDTPAGLVRTQAWVAADGAVESVTFENVPSFLWRRDVTLLVDGRRLGVDIAFGGTFYAIVSADALGVSVVPRSVDQLAKAGVQLRECVNRELAVSHPEIPHIRGVTSVQIFEPPRHPEAAVRNVIVFGRGSVDRSPCGTGTCAKMAVLYARGELGLGQEFVHEGILGGVFRGRLLRETDVGGYQAVIPEVTGRAFITGFHQFVIDPADPYASGFLLGDAGSDEGERKHPPDRGSKELTVPP